jgi:hypothetical protein
MLQYIAAFILAAFSVASYDFAFFISLWEPTASNYAISSHQLERRQQLPQPVLELPYTPGVMDTTVKHHCLWIRTTNPSNPNEANISYSESRRNDDKCMNCCPPTSNSEIEETSCHQAPFAKSYESGSLTECVSAYENAFQGWWLGQWFRDIKGGRDTAFGERLPILLRVTGLECDTVQEDDVSNTCGADTSYGLPTSGIESKPPFHQNLLSIESPQGRPNRR